MRTDWIAYAYVISILAIYALTTRGVAQAMQSLSLQQQIDLLRPTLGLWFAKRLCGEDGGDKATEASLIAHDSL